MEMTTTEKAEALYGVRTTDLEDLNRELDREREEERREKLREEYTDNPITCY